MVRIAIGRKLPFYLIATFRMLLVFKKHLQKNASWRTTLKEICSLILGWPKVAYGGKRPGKDIGSS